MSEVSAGMVKALRERTGAGMMDCKRALFECSGDMEASLDWLRQKGHARMAKKSDRAAREGLVALIVKGGRGVLLELSSETDFVARHSDFDEAARRLATYALDRGADSDVKKFTQLPSPLGGGKVEDEVRDLAAKLGENISIKRVCVVESPKGGVVASYLHNQQSEETGKIGVLVVLARGDEGTGRQIAMHISAARPLVLSKEDIDPALLAREREVLLNQAKEEGKPEAVVEKMVEGRLKKFYREVALLEQEYILEDGQMIRDLLSQKGAEISRFVCYRLGDV